MITEQMRATLSPQQVRLMEALNKIADEPTDTEAILEVANLYYDLREQASSFGDESSARSHAERALEYYGYYLNAIPDAAGARLDRAAVMYSLDRIEDAIAETEVVLEQDPENVTAHYNLATFLQKKGNDDRARAEFQKTMDLAASSSDARDRMILESARSALSAMEARD